MYPHKPAPIKYSVNDLIKNRWSPRVFADKLIEPEKIMSLFEAARWAPSARNEQPWRFVYAAKDNAEHFLELSNLLTEGNSWAKIAPLLIIVYSKRKFAYNSQENFHALYDAGAAAENLCLEAVNQGLFAHQMAGFDRERAIAESGLQTQDYLAVTMIAVGYPAAGADIEKLDKRTKESELAERTRLDLERIAFNGQWLNK